MLPELLPLTKAEIGKLLKAAGYNQKEAAEKLGVEEGTVSKWVTGTGRPSPENAAKLRALKPKEGRERHWNPYLAEVEATVAAIKEKLATPAAEAPTRPPTEPTPVPQVDPNALAESLAPRLKLDAEGLSRKVAQEVAATMPRQPDVEEVSERVAQKVVAAMPGQPDVEEVSEKVAQKVAARVEERLAKKAAQEKAERKATARGLVLWAVGIGAAVGLGGVVLVNCALRSAVAACVTAATAEASAATNGPLAWLWLPALATPTGARTRVGRPVPKEPFKGQMRAPCAAPFTAINGGCYLEGSVHHEPIRAPCPEDMYESGGYCFMPIGERGERLPSTVDGDQ